MQEACHSIRLHQMRQEISRNPIREANNGQRVVKGW
jgi:hypothetical protein